MTFDLKAVQTIVIVMMENRSFDNLLGYLSLERQGRKAVEGLGKFAGWEDHFSNPYNGSRYRPFRLKDPYSKMVGDPPHERDPIALQMGKPENGVFPMNGFVENYVRAKHFQAPSDAHPPPVMGYFEGAEAPVTAFLAENFKICDHWFSALPAGTQPNRLMAMSGYTRIDENAHVLPPHHLVYDWLTERGISWRVYHQGMPFFSLMPRWIPDIAAGEKFRPFERFLSDMGNDPPDERPKVIFVEPAYTDAPHLGASSDDHAPSGIRGGQEFLLEVYRAITDARNLWDGLVAIISYDEHGGFFDHVSPPLLRTDPPSDAKFDKPFESLGVRVPGIIVSPFVKPSTLYTGRLDHSSVLKFIGEVFDPAKGYSAAVASRDVGSISETLDEGCHREAPVIPSLADYLKRGAELAGMLPNAKPETDQQTAFLEALGRIHAQVRGSQSPHDDLFAAFLKRSSHL